MKPGLIITDIRAATFEELVDLGWEQERGNGPVVVIVFDDDSTLFASMDGELNGPGRFVGFYNGDLVSLHVPR